MKKIKWKIYGFFEWMYSRMGIYLINNHEGMDPDKYGERLDHYIERMMFWGYLKYSLF